MAHQLPDLPYPHNALEPYIDERTMQVHHGGHHQAYVNNLNAALEAYPELQNKSVEELLRNLDAIPEKIRTAVRNNGGGHYNHTLFWQIMSPNGGGEPTGELADAINKTFGSFDEFKAQFKAAALGVFGSGWAWLDVHDNGEVHIHQTPNQDTPISVGHTPIMGIDVWEHAYYLKYLNLRPNYIDAWWNVAYWDKIAENYQKARS